MKRKVPPKSDNLERGDPEQKYYAIDLPKLPECNFCAQKHEELLSCMPREKVVCPARFDGKTRFGAWAYMCEQHFINYGLGLGIGRGTYLYVPPEIVPSQARHMYHEGRMARAWVVQGEKAN